MITAPKDVSGYSNLTMFRDLLCIEVLSYLVWLLSHHGVVRLHGIQEEEKP